MHASFSAVPALQATIDTANIVFPASSHWTIRHENNAKKAITISKKYEHFLYLNPIQHVISEHHQFTKYNI